MRDILLHPTGGVIGRREACDVDIDAINAAAKATGIVLELDAYPTGSIWRTCASGASPPARRAWATAADVLNRRRVWRPFFAALKGGAHRT
jgi:hypothetical protein